jgi:ferredoxin
VDISFETLLREHDAVVLAVGKVKPETPARYGLERGGQGIAIDPVTFQTSVEKVFCGGDAVRPFVLVAHAVADGRGIARSVDEYLTHRPLTGHRRRFNSRIGRLQGDELERLVEGYDRRGPVVPVAGVEGGYSREEAVEEVGRCLHCECLKPDTCKLRNYADDYGARQDRYLQKDRNTYSRVLQHADVIFEPGKCVKCGLCVRTTEQAGEPLGLTFVERGFDVKISAPFDASLSDALGGVADEVVGVCPTAALSFKSQQLRKMPNR